MKSQFSNKELYVLFYFLSKGGWKTETPVMCFFMLKWSFNNWFI